MNAIYRRNVGNITGLVALAAGAALLGYAWRRSHRDQSDTTETLAGERGVHVRESLTINASPEELYNFWRSLGNLPEVMPHLDRVEEVDFRLSRWTAKAFGVVPLSWIAEIINEVPFETIGWKTLPGEAIQHAGSVVFKRLPENPPHHAGERVAGAPACATDVRVHFQYSPPGGKAAAWFAAFLGQDPAKLTRDGLHALKQRLEAGTVRATPSTSTT